MTDQTIDLQSAAVIAAAIADTGGDVVDFEANRTTDNEASPFAQVLGASYVTEYTFTVQVPYEGLDDDSDDGNVEVEFQEDEREGTEVPPTGNNPDREGVRYNPDE